MSSGDPAKTSTVVRAPARLAAAITSAVRPSSIACIRPTPPACSTVAEIT